MQLKRYATPQDFLGQVEPLLAQHEALNNLMLGISYRLRDFPARIEIPPYLATVEDATGIVLVALRTPPHNLLLFTNQAEITEAYRLLAQDLHQMGQDLPAVFGPESVAQNFAKVWADHINCKFDLYMQQRVFELRKVASFGSASGQLRQAQIEDTDLLAEWITAFDREALGESEPPDATETAVQRIAAGMIYFWGMEQPVSMAAISRPTKTGITINLVYTPPNLRGRGYATACVAHLSQLMLEKGWEFCSLFTDLANPTSNSIYQKIGYQPLGDFNVYRFIKS